MKKLILLLLIATTISSAEIFRVKFLASSELQQLGLFHDGSGFYIERDSERIDIKSYFVDPIIRNITQKQLNFFLDKGYISIKQIAYNEFILRANIRGLGGGPICAYYAYLTTKALCYGTAAAATTAAIVSTGGAAAAAIGVGGAATGAAATSVALATNIGATLATGGASLGASVVATSVSTLGLTAAATEATTVFVTSAGGVASATAYIEVGSALVSAFFAGPWCP